jgi:hypothetical protein
MKKENKKVWEKPRVSGLSVKGLTLSGTQYDPTEKGRGWGPSAGS